jgi:outer membrane receptor protein involved in Fe transport
LLITTAFGVATSAVAAAPPSGSDPAKKDDTPNADIIVTAGKREQRLSKVAGGISVVTSAQIDARGATSLADYIALTPGVNLQNSGATGWGWIEIRGIAPQNVNATVATYVDEIPISASAGTTRGGEYTPDFDPSDIARVEVLKGPQGTLYGASSLGGVLKYVTKGPSLTTTEIDTSEGLNVLNNGQFGTELRAALNTPIITDTLGIRVSGFYRHDAGWVDRLGPIAANNVNSGNDYGFRAALRWKVAPTLTVDLTGSIDRYKADGLSVVDLDPITLEPYEGHKDGAYRAVAENFRINTKLASATIKWDTNYGTLTSATGYTYQKPQDFDDVTGSFALPPPAPQDPDAPISYLHPLGGVGVHRTQKTTEELRFNSTRLGPIEFIAGGFYQHEKGRNLSYYSTYDTQGKLASSLGSLGTDVSSSSLTEYAGFLNATFYLTDRLDFTGGFRHSHIILNADDDTSGYVFGGDSVTHYHLASNSNTYLGGVRWRPTDQLTVYARAASGYRPGSSRSIPPGAPADFGTVVKSDSIWSYEAGVKYRTSDGRFSIDVDAFQIDWKDIQALIAVGRFAVSGNGGKARSRGFELQSSYELVRGLTISGNTALTDAKFTEDSDALGVIKGQRIFLVPKWTATIGADYRWALNDRWHATVGGDYSYRSSQLDISNFKLPGYSMVTLHAGAETDRYGINFYVKNLTNRHVLVGDQGYFADFPPYYAIYSQPRQIGVTFSQKF